MLACSICKLSKRHTSFSKSQRKKASQGKQAKCQSCVNANNTNDTTTTRTTTTATGRSTSTKESILSSPGATLTLRQPYASLAVSGIARILTMHSWRDGPVETVQEALRNTPPTSPITLWIHSAALEDKPNNDIPCSKLKTQYSNMCGAEHYPTKFPNNCLVGCVTVFRVFPSAPFLDGNISFSGNCSKMNHELFDGKCSNLLVIGNAKKLIMPLPVTAPYHYKKNRVWNLPKQVKHNAQQQGTLNVPCRHDFDIMKNNVSIKMVDRPALDTKFPDPTEQKASRRCDPEFWKIDTSVMRDPLQEDVRPPVPSMERKSVPPPTSPVVVWLRQDLRLEDNPALFEASTLGPVYVIYIQAPKSEENGWHTQGAAKMWLHHALLDVDNSLQKTSTSGQGGLICLDASESSTAMVLFEFLSKVGAKTIHFNERCEPWHYHRDLALIATLQANNINVHTFKSVVLFSPWNARPDTRPECMKVGFGSVGFFRRACSFLDAPGDPVPSPSNLFLLGNRFDPAFQVQALGLLRYPIKAVPKGCRQKGSTCRFCRIKNGLASECRHQKGEVIDWGVGIRSFWNGMTEESGIQALLEFLEENNGQRMKMFDSNERHRADRRSTAIISPYVRFGQLSPRFIVHLAKKKYGHRVSQTFLRRLVWRDLAYWSLWRFPDLPTVSFRLQYEKQTWNPDPNGKLLKAWQHGKTGYPLVDAAMRQLWVVGWMPNYMRHVVAGFLIEYLNLHWIHGEKWFHKTLVDADVAINAYMWQNGGHSGMDQWNFVMHPVFAAKTCDPDGEYVRRWVPELRGLSNSTIHCPWCATTGTLAAQRIIFNKTYPSRCIVNLELARKRSHEAVMVVRRSDEGKKCILNSGHEIKRLNDGHTAVLITRIDYREGKISTRQTADETRDPKRRVPNKGNIFGSIMKSEMEQYERTSQLKSEQMY